MSAAIAVPFLHPVLLTTVAIVTVVVFQGMPRDWQGRRLAIPGAILGGAAVAAVAALAGFIPWWGTITLALYTVFMLGGFAVAWALLQRRAHHLGIRSDQVIDLLLVSLVLGVIGARARYVWERWDQFATDGHGHAIPWADALVKAADLDAGGAVWYGGVMFVIPGAILLIRRWGVPLLAVCDLVMAPLLAGLAIGRIGCFFNGCCFGAPCSLPWAVPSPVDAHILVHPTQLYETIVCGMLAAGLWWFWGRRRSDGQVLIAGMIGYGIWRFINEGLRHESTGDDPGARTLLFGTLPGTTSQGTSLLLILGALVLAVWLVLRRRSDPAAAQAAALVPGSRFAAASAR